MIALIIIILFVMAGFMYTYTSWLGAKNTDLDIEMIPGDLDNVLESFRVGQGVDVSGIIGTDFMERYGYIIDFKRSRIWHNLHWMSFKEAMELIGIPYIVLWQDDRKYIFIIDSGSARSHISNKALEWLDYDLDTSMINVTVGAGGSVKAKGIVKTKFTYK